MSDFIANSQIYNISTENEVATILSHFNSNFIISIVNHNLGNRLGTSFLPAPNIVASFEHNFKDIKARYNANLDEIERVRLTTYGEIIGTICSAYHMQPNLKEDTDLYSAAYYIYDFFVCNFLQNLVHFFSAYIVAEKNSIYDSMNLNNLKKNKDSSTIYGKKIYKDIKLAVINANIDMVINNMASFDITFKDILFAVYDRNIANYILSLVSPIDDIYSGSYMTALMSDERSMILTNIRMEIQRSSIDMENLGGVTNE